MGDHFEEFIAAVESRAGCHDRAALERTIRATLGVLGSHMDGVPPLLRDVIPRDLHAGLKAGRDAPRIGPAAFYLMVSNEIGLRVGLALGITQSVLDEFSARLNAPSRQQLRALLPPAWAALVGETERCIPIARFKTIRDRPQVEPEYA